MTDFEKKQAALKAAFVRDIEALIAERTNQRLRDVVSISLIRPILRRARKARKG